MSSPVPFVLSESGRHYPIGPAPAEHSDLVRVYVWEWPVRLAHWGVVLSIAVLAVTGIYIGNPSITVTGPAGDHFLTGTFKVVHSYAAILFTLSVLSRLIWMFRGNHFASWDKFIPVKRRRRRGLVQALRFYLFQLRKPPGFIGHNPLAGATYTLVFLIYLVMVLTGFTLYGESSPSGFFHAVFAWVPSLLGGLQRVRFLHHISVWLYLIFIPIHIYLSLRAELLERTGVVSSIVSGGAFVPRNVKHVDE